MMERGEDGIDGVDGPQGAQGPQGPVGPQGIEGAQGPQGETGSAGPQGLRGVTGTSGEDGIDGVDGPQGPRGPKGFQGPQGSRGPKGAQGETGPAGVGRAGSSGAPGMMGVQGPQGPAGGGGGGPFEDLEVTNNLTVGNSVTTGVVTNDGNIQIVATDTGNVLIEGAAGVVIEADSGAVAITSNGGDVEIDTGAGDLIINGQPYSVGGQAIYGDGHQGDVVYSVDTQLDASVYANDITVEAGVTLDVNEWPIYARGTFLVEATAVVHGDGPSATGTGGGDEVNNYAALVRGGRGGDSGVWTGDSGAGGHGYYRAATTGNGGPGGDTTLFSGGVTDPDPWWNMQRSVLGGGSVMTNVDAGDAQNDGVQVRAPWAGGAGGGGGAGQAAHGGGGGQGGGPVVIAARHIINNGTIRTVGGAGADAADASGNFDTWQANHDFTPGGTAIQPTTHAYRASTGGTTDAIEPTWTDDGNDVVDGGEIWQDLGIPQAGGGGGGQGGNVFLIYDDFTGNEPTVDGGAGGAGLGDGLDGDPGDAGNVIHLSNT